MKKLVLFIVAALLCVVAVDAQSNTKALNKALKKEYKLKKKEFKKGKWELFASSRTLDVALLQHYEKLNALGENGYEVVGVASRFKSKNIGHQQAVNNACLAYAQKAGSHLKGRIVSDMAGNADDTSAEFDHFYAAYERLVEKEIKGEMIESFSIIRCIDKVTAAIARTIGSDTHALTVIVSCHIVEDPPICSVGKAKADLRSPSVCSVSNRQILL